MKFITLILLLSFWFLSCSQKEQISNKQKFVSKFDKASEYTYKPDKLPEPPGGIKNIQDRIIVPDVVKNGAVKGRVYVNTFVNENGTVDFVEVTQGLDNDCDKEALRVIKETIFQPGIKDGTKVKTAIVIPVTF